MKQRQREVSQRQRQQRHRRHGSHAVTLVEHAREVAGNTRAQEQTSDGQLQVGTREPKCFLQGNDQDAEPVQHRCGNAGRNTEPCQNQDAPAASELGELNPGGGSADGQRCAGDGIQTFNFAEWRRLGLVVCNP